MRSIGSAGERLVAWWGARDAELRLSARVTVAGVLTYAVVHALGLTQGFWAVLTAVIIMQGSVGGSLKAALDRLVGTMGGAAYGAAVAAFIPHADTVRLGLALAVALAPLALVAALKPSFRVAPVTAIIVLLSPGAVPVSPFESALDRVLEIALGSVIGLAVALLVLPARAHGLVAQAASRDLDLMAELLSALLGGLATPPDPLAILRLHDRIRAAQTRLEGVADEAARERRSHLTDEPDPDPLVRTLRRLRHDLVMIGRATGMPLPPGLHAPIGPSLGRVSVAVADVLRGAGAALVRREAAPALDAVTVAMADYATAMNRLRSAPDAAPGLAEAVDRLYALGFAFEQLRQNLTDLASRVGEFARAP